MITDINCAKTKAKIIESGVGFEPGTLGSKRACYTTDPQWLHTPTRPLGKGYHDIGYTESMNCTSIVTLYPTFSKPLYLGHFNSVWAETFFEGAQYGNLSYLKFICKSETLPFSCFFSSVLSWQICTLFGVFFDV